jgi:hypothetical protein
MNKSSELRSTGIDAKGRLGDEKEAREAKSILEYGGGMSFSQLFENLLVIDEFFLTRAGMAATVACETRDLDDCRPAPSRACLQPHFCLAWIQLRACL